MSDDEPIIQRLSDRVGMKPYDYTLSGVIKRKHKEEALDMERAEGIESYGALRFDFQKEIFWHKENKEKIFPFKLKTGNKYNRRSLFKILLENKNQFVSVSDIRGKFPEDRRSFTLPVGNKEAFESIYKSVYTNLFRADFKNIFPISAESLEFCEPDKVRLLEKNI